MLGNATRPVLQDLLSDGVRVSVLLEGMKEKVELITSGEKGPVFVGELVKEWHAVAQIQDVGDTHDV